MNSWPFHIVMCVYRWTPWSRVARNIRCSLPVTFVSEAEGQGVSVGTQCKNSACKCVSPWVFWCQVCLNDWPTNRHDLNNLGCCLCQQFHIWCSVILQMCFVSAAVHAEDFKCYCTVRNSGFFKIFFIIDITFSFLWDSFMFSHSYKYIRTELLGWRLFHPCLAH